MKPERSAEPLEIAAARLRSKIRGRVARLKKQIEDLNNTLERQMKASAGRIEQAGEQGAVASEAHFRANDEGRARAAS